MHDFRTPLKLSPSALARWESDVDAYFWQYIVPKEFRPNRAPQTGPMSVGSAFDAIVKNSLYKRHFGESACESDSYRMRDLIVQQCEEHTLPDSLVIACDVFEQYTECGALSNLNDLIQESPSPPRTEFEVNATIGGVPLMGKPDLHFYSHLGAHVIVDWKVSGAVSKCGVSPQQGYQIALDLSGTRTSGKSHKKYVPVQHPGGLEVSGWTMDQSTDYWADQLATYAWALGEPVGAQSFICRIEQLACRPAPVKASDKRLRVKSVVHQSTVDPDYQMALLERYQKCWHHVTSGHYFPELTRSQSDRRANVLIRTITHPNETQSPFPQSTTLCQPITWSLS